MTAANRVAGLGLLALAALVAFESRKYPLGSVASPGPAFWPLALSIVLGGLAVALLLARRGAAARFAEFGHTVTILAGVAFAALALERIGYRLTILVLMLFYLWAIERLKPWVAIAIALGFSLGTYALFHDLLRVQLPRGPWGI